MRHSKALNTFTTQFVENTKLSLLHKGKGLKQRVAPCVSVSQQKFIFKKKKKNDLSRSEVHINLVEEI